MKASSNIHTVRFHLKRLGVPHAIKNGEKLIAAPTVRKGRTGSQTCTIAGIEIPEALANMADRVRVRTKEKQQMVETGKQIAIMGEPTDKTGVAQTALKAELTRLDRRDIEEKLERYRVNIEYVIEYMESTASAQTDAVNAGWRDLNSFVKHHLQ